MDMVLVFFQISCHWRWFYVYHFDYIVVFGAYTDTTLLHIAFWFHHCKNFRILSSFLFYLDVIVVCMFYFVLGSPSLLTLCYFVVIVIYCAFFNTYNNTWIDQSTVPQPSTSLPSLLLQPSSTGCFVLLFFLFSS